MTRKLITTLLCLVLAVALPLAALADTRHTLTLIPGEYDTDGFFICRLRRKA